MVDNPENYFLQCQKNNVKRVIFHIETKETKNILKEAKKFNFQIGIALNPKTPIVKVEPFINEINVAVLMSVNPGKQGQAFIKETLDKIKELKQLNSNIKIEVDGGINLENIKAVSNAGADYMVVGSGLFKSKNIIERFTQLELEINPVK